MSPSPDKASAASSLKPRGSSQGGMRQYNERVVLQAIRLNGRLPGAEIARLTRLTAQSISLITKRLLEDELLIKETPQRGKVGQPSVPLALNPDGAFAIGIKVGRRSLDILLVDFTGAVRERWNLSYNFADPEQILTHLADCLGKIKTRLSPQFWDRIQGIGIAAPLHIGGWQQLLGLDANVVARWERFQLNEEIAALTGLPVQSIKDTTAACVAELVAGRGRDVRNFIYVFVDTFIGGGLVLDSHLHIGKHGNAGAIGSLALGITGNANSPQLLNVASLYKLESRFIAAGLDGRATSDERAASTTYWPHTQAWIAETAPPIAFAMLNSSCLLDLEGVILDGCFCSAVKEALIQAVITSMQDFNWEGIVPPQVLAGTIGSDARALGGALLPLYANFAPDRDLFLKLDG
ncbi:ROK family transcriptional regulator [Iodobacter fluviatilis]|uniref:Making large colonies protein n=1 Tax=Iodobacter fluviatilis TaxID=537 RepID=A0A377Q4U9_9NEIS|nr:ROK family transcriptional regulator [Iodobacter fluviatilis]TCU86954.1 putative NBD/HSP70 family sugar kinase [Iodobacter fluviatilis]STQ90286.1 Making large colonies protein [Iodobacter fluviatilis]